MEPWLSLCLADRAPLDPVRWSFAPETVIPLLLLAVAALRRRAWPLGLAALVLALAVLSPLCRLAAALASAHMTQHILLLVAAPLCLAAGLPRVRGLLPAAVAVGLLTWGWHLPGPYAAALLDRWVHLAMLASLVAGGTWFWAALRDSGIPGAAACFVTVLHTGLLAALLTLSPRPWFPVHGAGPLAWGLDPLADQQLAGALMWVPMAVPFVIAGLACFRRGVFVPGQSRLAR